MKLHEEEVVKLHEEEVVELHEEEVVELHEEEVVAGGARCYCAPRSAADACEAP